MFHAINKRPKTKILCIVYVLCIYQYNTKGGVLDLESVGFFWTFKVYGYSIKILKSLIKS